MLNHFIIVANILCVTMCFTVERTSAAYQPAIVTDKNTVNRPYVTSVPVTIADKSSVNRPYIANVRASESLFKPLIPSNSSASDSSNSYRSPPTKDYGTRHQKESTERSRTDRDLTGRPREKLSVQNPEERKAFPPVEKTRAGQAGYNNNDEGRSNVLLGESRGHKSADGRGDGRSKSASAVEGKNQRDSNKENNDVSTTSAFVPTLTARR